MDFKTRSAQATPRVNTTGGGDAQTGEFTLSTKMDADKLASKLEKRPRSELTERLLLVGMKRSQPRQRRANANSTPMTPPSIPTKS